MTTTLFAPVLSVVDADRPDSDLSVDELGSRIVGMSGRFAAATCRWLLLIADFDRREGCVRFGLHSTAYWLSHHCGIARRTAVEHVRVARALLAFPAFAEAMSAGRLSYSQVRAISRVPREGEHGVVADLIMAAEHGSAAQLEALVQGMRVADRADHPPAEPEYVRTGWSPSGQRRVAARLDADRGKVLDAALAAVAKAHKIDLADALVQIAEWALAIVHDERPAPRDLRGDEYAAVVVHLDADAYPPEGDQPGSTSPSTEQRGAEQPRSAERDADSCARPAGRIADGPGLSRQVIEHLCCAGRVRPILKARDGRVLDVGRSSRTVTKRQFRALLQRDRHCTHPGCTSMRKLEAHHVKHWLHGGRTDMNNLVLLCEAHHLGHHAGEFHIVPSGDQRWRYFRDDGRELLATVNPGEFTDSSIGIDAEYCTDPAAPGTRWDGQRLDRHYAVNVLAMRRVDAGRRAS